MKINLSKPLQWFKTCSTKSKCLVIAGSIILVAVIYSVCGTFIGTNKAIKSLYGEEIGEQGLRYKYREHIYNPKTGEILVDSIDWLNI